MCFRKVLDSWLQPLVIWCEQANADDVTVLGMERGIGERSSNPILVGYVHFHSNALWKGMDLSLYPHLQVTQTGISSIWWQPVSKKNYSEFEAVKKATVNYYRSQEYFWNNKEGESMESHDRLRHVIKYLSLHYAWFLCCIFTVNSWRSTSKPALISIVTFWTNFSSNPHAHMGGFQR